MYLTVHASGIVIRHRHGLYQWGSDGQPELLLWTDLQPEKTQASEPAWFWSPIQG